MAEESNPGLVRRGYCGIVLQGTVFAGRKAFGKIFAIVEVLKDGAYTEEFLVGKLYASLQGVSPIIMLTRAENADPFSGELRAVFGEPRRLDEDSFVRAESSLVAAVTDYKLDHRRLKVTTNEELALTCPFTVINVECLL